jgi:hypothetical protein
MTSPQPSLFPDITTRAERRTLKRLPEPDFDAISMGAGVQGTTIALLIAHGRLPTPRYAIFADTGWEPAAVYTQLDRINRELLAPNNIELITVTNGNIRTDIHNPHALTRIPAHVRGADGKPGMLKRTCTGHFKLEAVFRAHRHLLGATTRTIACKPCAGTGQQTRIGPPPPGHWIRAWIGFSTDEVDRCAPSTVPYSENHYPLLEDNIRFSREQCIDYNTTHGFPEIVKSACIGCPYRSDAEWANIKNNPDEWAQAVAADHAIRHQPGLDGTSYLHRARIPLELVDITNSHNTDDQHGCSPYGCRSGDPIDQPPLWDNLDEQELLA